MPIAVPDFLPGSAPDRELAHGISQIITANLKRSGLFAPIDQAAFIEKITNTDVLPRYPDWRAINAQALVTGRVTFPRHQRVAAVSQGHLTMPKMILALALAAASALAASAPGLSAPAVADLKSSAELGATTAEAPGRLSQIEVVLKTQEATGTVDTNDPPITSLCSQYIAVINREADWVRRYGPNHLAVANLRNQISAICNSIHEELRRNNLPFGEPPTGCSVASVCSTVPTR